MTNALLLRPDIMFLAGNARSLLANRGDLISELLTSGFRVAAAVPRSDYQSDVELLGIPIFHFDMNRVGMKPGADIRTFVQLTGLLWRVRPKAVFAYTVKPIVYGLPASRVAGVKRRYAMVTGLGHVYTTHSKRTARLRKIVDLLYRRALDLSEQVFFQNPDDLSQFRTAGVLQDESKAVLVNGSGVNLDRYPPRPVPCGAVNFVFIGRILAEKGITEFVQAARTVSARWSPAAFTVVGAHDGALPHAVSQRDYEAWKSEGVIDFVGRTQDVRPWLAASSVFVLPSYREGTPRAVLEAMSTGRAIITTDAPGCRETVVDGVNGFLVRPKDANDLALAMERYLADPELLRSHAEASLAIAREKYDVRKVNAKIMRSMELN